MNVKRKSQKNIFTCNGLYPCWQKYGCQTTSVNKPTYFLSAKPSHEGDTQPFAYCVPPCFGLAYWVPPIFGLAYCVPFNNKNNYFWRFHLHKEDKMTVHVCCMHMYNHFCKRKLWYVCLLNFLVFDLSKSTLKFINFSKKRERSESANNLELFDFVCHAKNMPKMHLDYS